jgi:hypothetical protein
MNTKGFCAPCFLVPAVIVVLIVIVLGVGWSGSFSAKECRRDSECASGSYCGADFGCHEHPVIKETEIITKENNVFSSFLLALGLAAFAAILKFETLRDHFGKSKVCKTCEPEEHVPKENVKPYYESVSKSFTSGQHSFRLDDPGRKRKSKQ